jgi:hypothetical protein
MGPEIYRIDPSRCTECVGHFDEPQCVQVCPVSCIPVDPARVESKDTLWARYRRLQGATAGAAGSGARAETIADSVGDGPR